MTDRIVITIYTEDDELIAQTSTPLTGNTETHPHLGEQPYEPDVESEVGRLLRQYQSYLEKQERLTEIAKE